VGDLEHALNLHVDVAEGHPEPSRQGARQSRPVEDASLTLGESRPLRDVMPPRGSGDASQANEAQGWVSHPSLPPGVMAPGGWPRTRGPVDDEEDAFPSLLPDGDDGLDQDPDLDAEAWDPSWDGGSPDQGSPEPARTRRRRWLPLLAAAVVLVLAAIAGFVYYQAHQSEAFRPYTTGTQPPFSLRYPESWKVNVGNAFSDVIISPKPDALGAALLQPGGEWGPTRQLLAESPSEAVGVYLNATASPPVDNTETALKAVILQYLGQHSKLDFLPTHHQFMVAGSAGSEFEGMLSDRQAPGTRLKVMIDYVQGPEGSVLLAFFAPPNRFEQLQPVFTEMRDTVRFTG
jgi:hypothetical protein